MLKRFTSFFILLTLTACSSGPVSQNRALRPKAFVTPWQYYSKARPAVLTDKDEVKIQKTASQPLSDESREDHTHAIIIGTIVGVLAVGGTVTGILLAR